MFRNWNTKLNVALALALVLAMAFTIVALADVITSDVDVVVGNQTFKDLGTVSPEQIVSTSTSFQLVCSGKNHADKDDLLTIQYQSATIPAGSLSVGDATIGPIPASWPDDTSGGGNTNCSSTPEIMNDNGNSSVSITAPNTSGTYDYVVTYKVATGDGVDPNDVTGAIPAVTFRLTVEADTTPPVITPNVSCDYPGNSPWCKGTIAVSWSVVDDESTITSNTCTPTTINIDTGASGQVVTCSATSTGGTSNDSVTVYRDGTPPTISGNVSPTAAVTGWYNASTAAPTVSFSCDDTGGSGLASCTSPVTLGNGSDQSVTGTATDGAGNSASAAVSDIYVDMDAPTISASINPIASGTGWYNLSTGAPIVSFACNDTGGSGLVGACPASVTLGNGADQSVSGGPVSDVAGNNSGVATVSDIDVDLDAPTISASISPDASGTGWYNLSTDAPTVSFICEDGGPSGLASCPADHTFGEGADQTYTGTAYDNAGNSASAGVSDVDVDLTAPSITAALDKSPAASGWFNIATGAPKVNFTCGDDLSGIASCPDPYTFGEGENQSHSGTAYDNAGNSASAGVSDVDVDLTAPTITWNSGPADGASYYFGFVPAAPTCTTSDTLSGPNGCSVSGYDASVGSHTMTATAYDVAGNKAEETRTYTVLAWTLKGFYAPVDMNGVVNVVKGGSTVPLKFEVFAGTTELTDTAIVSTLAKQVTCNASSEDTIEVLATGGTSLRYDSTSGQFIFNWQTPKLPGKCYEVKMTTLDGSSITALFKLK